MRTGSLCLVIGYGWLAASLSMGDTLRLKDGRALVGEVKRQDDVWAVTQPDGQVTRVPVEDVAAIEMDKTPTTSPDALNEKLESLRRSVAALDDIAQIIERYRRFIASSSDPKVAGEAGKDLATWQQRQADGQVRFAGQWMSPAQREAQIDGAIAIAVEAQALMQQGRVDQAQASLDKALELDPSNPTALFLAGVQLFTGDQPAAARKSFEAVLANLPRHAPSLANLGVTLWKLDAILPAVNCYDQALSAAPLERAILDNVAEVIQAIPRKQREENAVKRLTERFVAQDRELQEQMAQRGLYRWGSTWVDQEQMDSLQAAEAEIREKLNELEEQFDRVQDRIARIDEDIDANEREMRRLIATSYTRDRDGRMIRRSLPRIYYDIKEDNEELDAERTEQEAKLDELRALAAEVEKRLPVPRYTGMQKILGAEHAPMPRRDTVGSTRPASLPSD